MPEADKPHTTNPPAQPSPRELLGNSTPLGDINVPDGIFLPGLDTTDTYALRLIGRALEPVATSGEHAIVCPKAPCEPGDFVALLPMDENNAVLVRRLVMPSPVPIGAPHVGSNVRGVVLVELLSERELQEFPADEMKAVHRVIGFLKRDGSMAEMPMSDRVRRGH